MQRHACRPLPCLPSLLLRSLQLLALLLLALLLLSPLAAAQSLSGAELDQLLDTQRARIEALPILGADFGLESGEYHSTGNELAGTGVDTDITVNKFGGAGDVGDPRQLGTLPIGWQPVVQGSMGWLDSTNHLQTGPLAGNASEFSVYAIQFGGGARLWLNDALSVAPTVMGMYGRTSNTYDAYNLNGRETFSQLAHLGLVDWEVDTWTVRPALDVQYLLTLDRTIITLTSDGAFFDTESFSSSNSRLNVVGTSGSWDNKLDIDIPLGIMVFGHELRTGGYLSRTDLYGGLRDGLQVEHINEVHTRLVLDFLDQLWKVQWIGIGGSYLWGTAITGWTVGADVMFRF
jgi:hypothetical protein